MTLTESVAPCTPTPPHVTLPWDGKATPKATRATIGASGGGGHGSCEIVHDTIVVGAPLPALRRLRGVIAQP